MESPELDGSAQARRVVDTRESERTILLRPNGRFSSPAYFAAYPPDTPEMRRLISNRSAPAPRRMGQPYVLLQRTRIATGSNKRRNRRCASWNLAGVRD